MSFSLGKSDSSNRSQADFNQDVWGPQGEALTGLYGAASNLFGGKGVNPQIQQGAQLNQNVMTDVNPYWQNQMAGGAYSNLNLGSNLMDSLNQSMGQPSAVQDINQMIMGGSGNNYADAMRDQVISDAGDLTDRMMQGADQRAMASGMTGSSGHQNIVGSGMDDISENAMNSLSQIGYNTFDKDLDRKLQIANQADQNTFNRQQLMSNMLGQQQNAMNSGLNFGNTMFGMGTQTQMMPWQQLGAYANVIGGPTTLSSGSSSGNSDSKGLGFSGGNKK